MVSSAMSLDELQKYGQSKASEISQRRERRKVELEKASSDAKLKAVWAGRLWEQVLATVGQRAKAVNDALGEKALSCEAVRDDLLIVRVAQVSSNLSAAYDPSTGRVTLTLDDHTESYDLEVVKGEVKFKAVGYFSPTQVAKMLVDKAASLVL